jgi:cyanophycinase
VCTIGAVNFRRNAMTIALIGGGEFSPACSFDAQLLEWSGVNEVLVLPIASAFEHPQRLVDHARSHFAELGATVATLPIIRRADANEEALVAEVARHHFVYLTDGSPMHLRSVLKDTAMWEALVEVERVGVVAASGAAAMLVTDPMYDPRGGAFTLGLGIVSPVTVLPAHETWSPERSRRTRELAPSGVPVVNLDTGTAVIRGPQGWVRAGEGAVRIYCDGVEVDLSTLPVTIQ